MTATTRTRLVKAARDLFAARGYADTGVAEIAKRADARPGSLYHAFPAKSDVLVAVLEDYIASLGPHVMEPAWRGVKDPIARVFAVLGIYRKFLADTDCRFGCPIGSLALELRTPDANVRQLIAQNFQNWTERVRECLDEAGERLPDTIDRKKLATFVLTTMEGAVMLARTERNLKPFDDAVTVLRDYFDRLETA